MKSKVDSGRMISRVTSLQEENECLHAQIGKLKEDNAAIEKKRAILYKENEFFLQKIDELRKKIAMQEKALAILKRVCHGGEDCKPLQN